MEAITYVTIKPGYNEWYAARWQKRGVGRFVQRFGDGDKAELVPDQKVLEGEPCQRIYKPGGPSVFVPVRFIAALDGPGE